MSRKPGFKCTPEQIERMRIGHMDTKSFIHRTPLSMWRTSADTDWIDIFKLRNGSTVVATMYDGSPYLAFENGTDEGSSSLNKAANTTYYVWFYFRSNYLGYGTWDVYVSTTTTEPETPTCRLNGSGISSSSVDNIWFSRSTGSGYNYYDSVWISDSDTGWATSSR